MTKNPILTTKVAISIRLLKLLTPFRKIRLGKYEANPIGSTKLNMILRNFEYMSIGYFANSFKFIVKSVRSVFSTVKNAKLERNIDMPA